MAARVDESADERERLRRRVRELEIAVAALESHDVVAPYVEAAAKYEATIAALRERCDQVERENATLSLALAYQNLQTGDADAAGEAGGDVVTT
mmetsp:Transcript_29114/g.90085  ORF Transcript_29114/g.90085 Transcript_29114/m.90085 type:complete len:94 (-) Transcript_29114:17-298(-)